MAAAIVVWGGAPEPRRARRKLRAVLERMHSAPDRQRRGVLQHGLAALPGMASHAH